jgi:hypothetical protein
VAAIVVVEEEPEDSCWEQDFQLILLFHTMLQ